MPFLGHTAIQRAGRSARAPAPCPRRGHGEHRNPRPPWPHILRENSGGSDSSRVPLQKRRSRELDHTGAPASWRNARVGSADAISRRLGAPATPRVLAIATAATSAPAGPRRPADALSNAKRLAGTSRVPATTSARRPRRAGHLLEQRMPLDDERDARGARSKRGIPSNTSSSPPSTSIFTTSAAPSTRSSSRTTGTRRTSVTCA